MKISNDLEPRLTFSRFLLLLMKVSPNKFMVSCAKVKSEADLKPMRVPYRIIEEDKDFDYRTCDGRSTNRQVEY